LKELHPHPHRAPDVETHFTSGLIVRDVVIGMADGLTVPFALAAGLSGSIANTSIVVIAGIAEIAAGSIAMGLGGYLAAKSDAEHYVSERKREEIEVVEKPQVEADEITEIFEQYGLSHEESQPLVQALSRNPKLWVDFMMRYELGLEEPDPKRARTSAATIAASYVAGGFIPLAPYMIFHAAHLALLVSVAVTMVALAVFGYIKGRYTGASPVRSALQTTLVGSLAAAAAFAIARLIS
jgi:VIT1/CCC1 family predicted Fe2+/Mn2+ transporter